MIKTLLAQVKEFKKASFLTPVFMILEVVVETMIPLVMADMIDNGVEAGNISYLYRKGAIMALLAVAGLVTGILGGKYGAYASSGFARNLRKAMYTNIQTFSFSNIDKFSTAGLVTRMTTDVTNLSHQTYHRCNQYPECLSDDPAYVYPCPGQSDLCHGDGVYDQCKGCQHLPDCCYFSWMFSRIYYEKGD